MDLLAVVDYVPPKSLKQHEAAAKKMTKWIEVVYDRCGRRTMLLFGGDFNNDFGLCRNSDGRVASSRGKEIGGRKPMCENVVGAETRRMCVDSYLTIASTWFTETGPTYHGTDGHTSRIDNCTIPAGALQLVKAGACRPFAPRRRATTFRWSPRWSTA